MSSATFAERLTSKLMGIERNLAGLATKTADLGNLKMSYYENKTSRGKPTLVLVHGYTADKTMWHRMARLLAKDYHIIAPDMAGHGATPYDPNAKYDIPTQVNWLAALLDHIGVNKAHIVGSSMGGFIAARFALSHPERTLSAVLLDPAGVTAPELSEIAEAYEHGRNLFLPANEDEFYQFLDMAMEKPPYMPKFIRKALARNHLSRVDSYAHIFNDFFDHDFLEDKLGEIKVPVLLIWGRKDKILHVSAVPIWQAGLPNCKTIIWDDLGHIPSYEAPKRTAKAIRAFTDA